MTRNLSHFVLAIALSSTAALPALASDTSNDPSLVPLNLAQGKPATASGAQEGRDAAFAADGDDGTRWCASDSNPDHWWQVDLQSPEDLTGLRIAWEFDGGRYRYKAQGSADGKTWTLLSDRTGDNAPPAKQDEVQKVDAKGVRFVRVTTTSLETGQWASLNEVEVFGNKKVNAASVAKRKNSGLIREIKAPAEFKVTLFAAPPEISYPVCLVATPEGDVFVATDANGSIDQKTARGKIVRCRDTNNDGAADEFKTFVELDSPRGMVWDSSTSTMYVQHPPFIHAFHDDNGDGVSDRKELLVEGLGFDLNFRGADHTTNGMQIGIDGWLYIAVGDYGFVKATGHDGKSLQLLGGGVVRVRPDGTQLEIVSRGQRNIYDVAVSPTLDLFTRDNTNDGDGWDVRLTHVNTTGQYGYPSLYKHFTDETLAPLGIYGGGSPTGSIYLDEPELAKDMGRGLYTCDWGRNIIYRHPLQPDGATFKAEQEVFVEMPRPIDMVVDGQSKLYVASWRNGSYTYSGPEVGYVARLIDPNSKPAPLVDLKKSTDAELVALLGDDSHVWRLAAQRELLHRYRGKPRNRDVWNALVEQMTGEHPLATQVAALFTFAQLENSADTRATIELLASAQRPMREYAIRALADDAKYLAAAPTKVFTNALKDSSPRIRLQAVIALGKLGKTEMAADVLPLLADADPVVSHAAIKALVSLNAIDPCLAVLDRNDTPLVQGALRVLQAQYDPRVVEGLVSRLQRTSDASLRQPVLVALCRLYTREAAWAGGWWGTRPDTSGPYFNAATWEQSGRILETLRGELASADGRMLPFLLAELQRHKIEIPEAMPRLIELAKKDAAFQAVAADFLSSRPTVPNEAIAVLADVAGSKTQDLPLRARAIGALSRSGQPEAFAAAVGILSGVSPDAPEELKAARTEFIRDPRHASQVAAFGQLAESKEPAQRDLGYAVLLRLATAKKKIPNDAAAAAEKIIDAGFAKPEATVSLLQVIGREKVVDYAEQVRTRTADANPSIRDAAKAAAEQLDLMKKKNGGKANAVISSLPFERTLALAQKAKGDVKTGAELFTQQGCIACHTVAKNDPPKGPYLGGIAQRYSRPELIESIVKPNAKIAQGFSTHYFITKKRQRIDGFIVREGGDEVEVRDASGVSTILKNTDIARKGTVETSIMPQGLVDAITPQDLVSLLAYLESVKAE